MLTFKLCISITAATAAAIKRDVAEALPGIKSSHLSEAIARGLGFNTHASLLASVGSGSELTCQISARAYSAFLRERGHDVDERPLCIAAGRIAIRAVMGAHPMLTHWGYGIGRPMRKSDSKWESAVEHHARFLVERERLLSDEGIEEFLRSLVLVQLIVPMKTINRRSGSYGLKHRAEKLNCSYPCGTTLGPDYVANGSLIAAAVHAGFAYKTYVDDLGHEDVNVAFNMSQNSLDEASYSFLASKGLSEEQKRSAARRLSGLGAVVDDKHANPIP